MVRAVTHGAMGRRIDPSWGGPIELFLVPSGARCSSVVRTFAHGTMGRRIDPSWSEPIELFLVPSGARCSSVVRAFAHGAMGRRIDHSWGGPQLPPLQLCTGYVYTLFHKDRDVAAW